jgi:sugar phosphate isomerase/epimerase
MQRRTFLGILGSAAAGAAEVPIRLGMDTYSIRAFRWKDIQLLDYAASLKLDAVQISSLNDYQSLEPVHLGTVKEHAERLGLVIDAGIGSICPTSTAFNAKRGEAAAQVLEGLQVARSVGAKAMRCFLGSAAERRSKLPLEAHMEGMIKVLRSVRAQALDSGVKIAIENHNGDMEAREVRTVIEEAGKDFVGSCLDTGNPMWLMEDPLLTLETLAPYVVTSHVRDSCVWEHPRGAAFQWVAWGDGSIDWRAFLARYRVLCPHATMHPEVITGRPPAVLPYFDHGFWTAFPNKRASEFARFVELARKGHPFLGTMVVAGGGKASEALEAALKEQQRTDFERSVEYAKKILGLGVRWKS